MHLIEQYSLSCGVKIDKPFIDPSFFPIAAENYITIHASNRTQSKTYDYYNDVVELIYPYLESKNIKIIQIGSPQEQKIIKCSHHQGHTSIKQAAYIIKNSMLHLGTDSFSTHIASSYNKKIVSLYSSSYKECSGPYWGEKFNQILLEPDRSTKRASFSETEYPKTINEIMPEKVAQSVLDLLNIKHNLHNLETFHIGTAYHASSLSVVPNCVLHKNFAEGQPANILGNEYFDEENIIKWAYTRKVNLFLNQAMQINYLKTVKNNINQINYFVEPDDNDDFFKACRKLGINLQLVCKDKNKINDTRLKFFDWNVLLIEPKTKNDIDNNDKICNNTRYKSAQVIVSDNKIYASKAAWRNSIEGEHNNVIDCDEFWEDAINLKLYNDNNHGT